MKYSREISDKGSDSLSQIAAQVPRGAFVLDLGIGTGSLGRYLTEARACRVHGADYDVAVLDSVDSGYELLAQADLEQAEALEPFAEYRYDAIVLADVLEHIRNPAGLLPRAAALLAPGGRLLVSVPNVGYAGVVLELLEGRFEYRDEGILDDTHVRFYTRDTLLELFSGCGLHLHAISAVEVPLDKSEFDGVVPELIPASLRDALARRGDSLAYQYIASVSPEEASEAPDLPEVDFDRVQGRFETRVYWMARGDLNHQEAKQISQLVPMGEEESGFEFLLEDPAGIENLRYMPADRSGSLGISRFELEDLDSGQCIDLLAEGAPRILEGLHQALLFAKSSGTALALQLLGPHSWFEIDLGALFADSPPRRLRLAISQSWPRSQDYQPASEQLLAAERENLELGNAVVEHRAHRRGLEGEVFALKDQVEELQTRLQAVTTSRAWRYLTRLHGLAQRVIAVPVGLWASCKSWLEGLGDTLQEQVESWKPDHWDLEVSAIYGVEESAEGESTRYSGTGLQLFFAVPEEARGQVVYFEIGLDSPAELMGPRLFEVIDGEKREVLAPLYVNRKNGKLFGTLRLPEELESLALEPSRLDCSLRLDSFRLTQIRPWVQNTFEGQWHWLWFYRVYGGRWVLERWRDEIGMFFENFPRLGKHREYSDWWEKYSRIDSATLDRQRDRAANLSYRPLISMAMPVYNVAPSILRRTLDSVLRQSYDNWELCVADDASPSAETRACLKSYEQRDPRIRVVYREENGHISLATNSALELAGGDYIGFMDHDDELAPNALFEVACALNRDPRPRLVYSDEDIIDEQGHHIRPHFKPDWNPDFFLSVNYFCHLVVAEAALVHEVGGLRAGYEGAQDYDLNLRLTARLEAGDIHHIPKVLYHWRAMEGSTAQDIDNKDYAVQAGVRAIEDHLVEKGVDAWVDVSEIGTAYRVHYPVPEPVPSVAILMPTRNGLDILSHCVGSVLEKTDYPDYLLTIIDNQSDDPATLEYLTEVAKDERVEVLSYDQPFNFAGIMNAGVDSVDADIVVLLNNDMEVINHDWLRELVSHAAREDIGAVGGKLFFPSEHIQHAGVVLGLGPDAVAGHAHKGCHKYDVGHMGRLRLVQNYSAVTGACLALRRSLYLDVGGMDAENLSTAFNDVDLCLKLQAAGYRNLWTPFAQLYHFESISRGYDSSGEKRARFERERDCMLARWPAILRDDPCYNPNLTRQFENFGWAWPPVERD